MIIDNVCDGYTGVIHGLRAGNEQSLLVPYVKNILKFLETTSQMTNDDVLKKAAGVLG